MNIQNLVAMTKGDATSPLFQTGSNQSAALQKEGDETAAPTASQTSTAEEFTTFLTLLTAQIKNQDPLAPLDSTQFVEQLATFSQLELQANGNAVLENIASMLAQNLYAANNTSDSTSDAET